MADVLDESAPDVQPEVFRQGMTEPEPETAPQPAPEPEAAPEPEPEPVAPSWLDEPAHSPQPEYPPQAPADYPHNVPQYPPQAHIPQPGTQRGLEAFVNDPDNYINALVEQRLNQAIAPLAQSQQMMMGVTNQMLESQIRTVKTQADSGIKRAYDRFNKDSSFKSNRALQGRIENAFRGLRANAEMAARNGDFTAMLNLANMTDAHISATLAAAKAMEGTASPGVSPLQVVGASVESTHSAAQGKNIELTAEQQELANRIGGNYADRMRKAIAEAEKYDDFEG